MSQKQISDIQTGIWLIGLAILFMTDRFWPGILILIGVSMVTGSLLRDRFQSSQPSPSQFPNQQAMQEKTDPSDASDTEELPDPSPRSVQDTASVPLTGPIVINDAQTLRPVDRLPEKCDDCGAPIRGMDVHWTGFDTANCGFCGSSLKMK